MISFTTDIINMWFPCPFVIQTDTKIGVLLYNIEWSIGHFIRKQTLLLWVVNYMMLHL